ncbi:hypothetical protein BC628DRAFT_1411479 [Trametes gibbosa]|nr:hypothetical protein BC628DRAFT_1411479 [Trametes gibbosa]
MGNLEEYPTDDVPSLHGKTALITGATTGAGLEVAKVVASKGARVLIVAGRQDNPDTAFEQIRQYFTENGDLDPSLNFVECDLANVETVKRAGDEVCDEESRLDIRLGVQLFDVSEDGIDRHFAVSHLGHFLLLNHRLPLLQRTTAAPNSTSVPRIVCVSSVLHAAAPSSATFVSHAELRCILLALALRALALATDPGLGHPGQSAQLAQAYGVIVGPVTKAAATPLERTPAHAARSTLWAATEWERCQGAYIVTPGQQSDVSTAALDEERGARPWEMSEDLVRRYLDGDALRLWKRDVGYESIDG